MDAQATLPVVGTEALIEDSGPLQELKQSIFLLALMASTMTTYVAIGIAAVRIFSSR